MKRRISIRTGKRLHCCCVCGELSPWGKTWSWYGSYKQIDDAEPVLKFCHPGCQDLKATVTPERLAEAHAAEWTGNNSVDTRAEL